MEPASIIGITSSVLDFIDHVHKFISTVYSIYDSASGKPLEYERLEDVIAKMNGLSLKLISQSPTLEQSEDEKRLDALASNCYALSGRIMARLNKTRAKKKHSLIESIKAASKTLWTKDDIDALKLELDRCTSQLTLQLTAMTRSEHKEDFERLIKAKTSNSREFASLHRLLFSLRDGVRLDGESFDQIRDLFSLSDEALKTVNQNRILERLKYDIMDERFLDVAEAAPKTFNWILEDQEPTESTNRSSFKEWLTSGTGIFHISGKPGSGKSTLMKLLCQNSRTTEELQIWAGDKKLVFARFFFWKQGKPLQKNLKGLIRALLYSVLKQTPEIIESIFPEFWFPSQHLLWNIQPDFQIGDHQVFAAFDNIIQNGEIYKKHRFCFFIDGLDEFDDDKETPVNLVKRLQKWAESPLAGVKLCVSSRELPTFQYRFSDRQRLKLQDLTRNDIKQFICDKLDAEDHFLEIKKRDEEGCQRLIDQMVEKADGVFLWISLALRSLSEGLERRDTLPQLERKLHSLPQELDEFFCYILNSIDRADCKEAYCVFLIVSKLQLYSGFSLFQYSFLDDVLQDSELANKQPLREMSDEEVKGRLDDATARISGVCKGLLELRNGGMSVVHKSHLIHRKVKFTHRSVPEFLEKHIENNRAIYLKSFDVAAVLAQLLILEIKQVAFHARRMYHIAWQVSTVIVHSRLQNFDERTCFETLETIDELLFLRQQSLWPDLYRHKWSRFQAILPRSTREWLAFRMVIVTVGPEVSLGTLGIIVSLPYIACFSAFDQYLKFKIDKSPDILADDRINGGLLYALLIRIFNSDNRGRQRPDIDLLRFFFRNGVDPHYVVIVGLDSVVTSIWQLVLATFASIRPSTTPNWKVIQIWQVVQTFLEFGADPRCWVEFTEKTSKRKREKVFRVYCPAMSEMVLVWKAGANDRLVESLRERGGKASVRDMVELYPPENADEVRELIDRSLEIYNQRDTLESPCWLEKNTEADSGTILIPILGQEVLSQAGSKSEVQMTLKIFPITKELWNQLGNIWRRHVSWTAPVFWFTLGVVSVVIYAKFQAIPIDFLFRRRR